MAKIAWNTDECSPKRNASSIHHHPSVNHNKYLCVLLHYTIVYCGPALHNKAMNYRFIQCFFEQNRISKCINSFGTTFLLRLHFYKCVLLSTTHFFSSSLIIKRLPSSHELRSISKYDYYLVRQSYCTGSLCFIYHTKYPNPHFQVILR